MKVFFFFFFSSRVFPTARQSPLPVATLVRSLAARGYGELPAHVGKDLVQLGRVPSEVTLAARWELKEGRGKSALRNNPDQRATHADRAAGRSATDAVGVRCCANRRSQVAASLPERPPT